MKTGGVSASLIADVRDLLRESVTRVVQPKIIQACFSVNKASFGDAKSTQHYDGVDYVTPIDKANESFLIDNLSVILPGSFAVGEETFELDPHNNLHRMKFGYSWTVDPLDGTNNVAKHIRGELKGEEPSYGVMISLLHEGRPEAGWIFYSNAGKEEGLVFGGRGHGVLHQDYNASRVVRLIDFKEAPPPGAAGNLVMTTVSAYPKDYQAIIKQNMADGNVSIFTPPPKSAAVESALFLQGRTAGVAFRQFRVWDHAPVFALAGAAGGHAAFMNGDKFDVARQRMEGALVARSKDSWNSLRQGMLGNVVYDHTVDPPLPGGLNLH